MNIENSYPGPVSSLLSLGKVSMRVTEKWRDYSALGISSDHVSDLIRMAIDPALNDGPGESKLIWAPLHAWRALAQVVANGHPRAVEVVKALLTLLRRIDDANDDWVADDVPKVLGRIGEPAIAPVTDYLADETHGEWARVAASQALGKIAESHPELRTECIARLAAQLEKCADQSETLNAFIIAPLWDVCAVEALPVIERAYAGGHVDESINGDFEDLQIEWGLKAKREHSRQPNALTRISDEVSALRQEIEAYERENAELRETVELLELAESIAPKRPTDSFPQPYVAPPKIGRNDPCPCGSGKKYKKCCGR
jgi:Predicted metal-binding protein related to the C-terminal domain of SecA